MRTCPGKPVILLFGLDDEISTEAVRAFFGLVEKSASQRPSFLKHTVLLLLSYRLSLIFLVVIPEGDLLLLLATDVAVALPVASSSPSHPKNRQIVPGSGCLTGLDTLIM
jgi:hypothetical protein